MSRISRQTDLVVCGEAANVAEALRLVETTQPDVVVIDISLKEGNGIDLIKRIRSPRRLDPDAGMFDAPRFVYAEAIAAGRGTRLHQQGQHDRPDSRCHSIGAKRRDLSERRCNSAPGAQDDRALSQTPGCRSNHFPIASSRYSS